MTEGEEDYNGAYIVEETVTEIIQEADATRKVGSVT